MPRAVFKMVLEKISRSGKTTGLHCLACKGFIRGKPQIMTLQITSEAPRFLEKAKKLGFTSTSWHTGSPMKGSFHKKCFDSAALIWEVAFETRAVSPRC